MPNVVFMDGLDSYNIANTTGDTTKPGLHSKWVIVTRDGLRTATGRFGGQAISLGDSFYGANIRAFFLGNTYLQQSTAAFAFKAGWVAVMDSHGKIFNFMRDTTSQASLGMTENGGIQIFRGTTLLAQSDPNLIRQGSWHFIEIEYVGHTSSGRMTVYLDGTAVVNYTGNTQAQTAFGFNGIQFSGNNASSYSIDDIFVIDEATRLGERRIETLRPNGDVSINFTPSTGTDGFATIDETLVSEVDYNSAINVNSKDIFNFTNLSTSPDVIDAVQVNVWATKTDVATRQLATLIKSGTIELEGTPKNLPVNHTIINQIINADPNTSQPWTASGVNSLQAGYRIVL